MAFEAENQVWMVTGSNRGIGRAIAEEILRSGGKVIAGTRELAQLDDLKEKHRERILPVLCDVNKESEIRAAVAGGMKEFGRIDVLVNNAGYGLQGMIEEVSMKQVREQMETNFFGLVALTQEVIPIMRKQGSGWIINVSSIAGMRGMAGLGIYNASKFAVEGFSEALAKEMEPFNIRVSIVEPGPYRTDWAGSSLDRADSIAGLDAASPYYERNKALKESFEERSGKQPGNPRQIAKVLLSAYPMKKPPLHMLFGDVAINLWKEHLEVMEDPEYRSYFPHDQFEIEPQETQS